MKEIVIELIRAASHVAPSVIICLIVFILVRMFRTELVQLIKRFRCYKYGDKEWTFDNNLNEENKKNDINLENPSNPIEWKNTGSLVWLSHDLLWTIKQIQEEAPGRLITHGIRQTLHHASVCKLENTPAFASLLARFQRAKTMLDEDWSLDVRKACYRDVLEAWQGVFTYAQNNQPNFAPYPIKPNFST